MFKIPNHVVKRVWEALPEQLKNSRDWKGFRINNSHLTREFLAYDFGKYRIYLSCRYSDEPKDWPNVKWSYGPSGFINVLHGEMEILLSNRKKKGNKVGSYVATVLLGEGNSFYPSNRSAILIIPRSPMVYTLDIAVRIPKLEKIFLTEEKLSPDRIDELASIFRGYFPTAQEDFHGRI